MQDFSPEIHVFGTPNLDLGYFWGAIVSVRNLGILWEIFGAIIKASERRLRYEKKELQGQVRVKVVR